MRDLRRGEPAHRAKRERDLDLRRKRLMAAGEDQPEHVVVERGCVFDLVAERGVVDQLMRQRVLLAAERDLPADAIDRLVARDIDQPGARIGRRRRGRPALERHGKGFLQHILGQIEIADETDQRRQRATGLVTEDSFDLGGGHANTIAPIVIPGRCEASNAESRDSGFAR